MMATDIAKMLGVEAAWSIPPWLSSSWFVCDGAQTADSSSKASPP